VQPFFRFRREAGETGLPLRSQVSAGGINPDPCQSIAGAFLVLLCYQKRIAEEQDSRRGLALQKQAQITGELGALKETELQFRQIKSWEPILRGRMPGSAVLGAVEQTIPQEVVLSRIAMEAANYRLVLLSPGSFRVPETYTITLEGSQKVQDPAVWESSFGNSYPGFRPEAI